MKRIYQKSLETKKFQNNEFLHFKDEINCIKKYFLRISYLATAGNYQHRLS